MMTPEQIAAMQYETIDAQAKDIKKRDLIIKNQAAEIERLKAAGAEWMEARKGSVSPDAVRATFDRLAEAESALVAAFDGAKPSAKPGIPWRDGPPPAEWRDGRQVLVWAPSLSISAIVLGWADVEDMWSDSAWQITDSVITHHAAITKPGEPHADT